MPQNPLALPVGPKQYIEIEAQNATPDANGEIGWEKCASGWAVISTMGSREVYQASQYTSQVTHVLSMAYPFTDIAAGMRVKFGVLYFSIQAVVNVQFRNRRLDLHCVQIDGGTNS